MKIDVLKLLNEFEQQGKGFFNRGSKHFTVFIRGAHGNDPMQWANAHKLQTDLGIYGGSIWPDAMSGHLIMEVRFPKESK